MHWQSCQLWGLSGDDSIDNGVGGERQGSMWPALGVACVQAGSSTLLVSGKGKTVGMGMIGHGIA